MKTKPQYALLTIAIFIALPAISQTNNMMETITAQLKMLQQFKGYWETGAATMKTGGKEYQFAYYADFKAASDDNGIVMHEWANIPGVGKLDGNNLAGINRYDGKIHWFSVDNMGTAHEHIGEFTDDKHFTMVHKSMQGGKEFVETLALEFTSPNELSLKQVATLDGEEVVVITGTFHRKKV
jgi:hypothetical protein